MSRAASAHAPARLRPRPWRTRDPGRRSQVDGAIRQIISSIASSFARAVQGSNSIEGYDASLDDVIAPVDDEPTFSADEEARLALSGYRETSDPFELASGQLSLELG